MSDSICGVFGDMRKKTTAFCIGGDRVWKTGTMARKGHRRAAFLSGGRRCGIVYGICDLQIFLSVLRFVSTSAKHTEFVGNQNTSFDCRLDGDSCRAQSACFHDDRYVCVWRGIYGERILQGEETQGKYRLTMSDGCVSVLLT